MIESTTQRQPAGCQEDKMKILILFYSTYGHMHKMALAAAEGASRIDGAQVDIKRIPETLPEEVLAKMGATDAQKAFAHIPLAEVKDLKEYDAIIFGVPTRYGLPSAQVQTFLDKTGGLWSKGSLVGKLAGVMTGSGTPHGGQETTIRSVHTALLHHGMVLAGLPYTFPGISRTDEVTGGSPYGASYIVRNEGQSPTDNELDGALYQGEYIAGLAKKMTCCKESSE